MRGVPTSALLLGLAGLIPFVWGALTQLMPSLASWGMSNLGARYVGVSLVIFYGTIILAFMSGVLWGFATKTSGLKATVCYALSVVPALWGFIMTGSGATTSGLNLIYGFLGLLALDFAFWSWRLAPSWWMRLRIVLTVVVVACLGVGVFL